MELLARIRGLRRDGGGDPARAPGPSLVPGRSINAGAPMERCVVDNRVLLLGLDEFYRTAMQGHERAELLRCARAVTAALRVPPPDVPVEGYYADDPYLSDYFRLMRALQETPEHRTPEVAVSPDFRRLLQVSSSPLYGQPAREGKLLPRGRDAFSYALRAAWPDWTVPILTTSACAAAMAADDFSLVGLAARIKDPVVLTALRETVVLYAEGVLGCAMTPRREFLWQVDDELAMQAQRFVDAFNVLFGKNELPAPIRQNAEAYWEAYTEAEILGRCGRLGDSSDGRHYHWAICQASNGEQTVHEFWHDEIWTTARYREALQVDGGRPEV